jgi:hypothetical protein
VSLARCFGASFTQPWDATDFLIRDLDGNLICFASPTEKQN